MLGGVARHRRGPGVRRVRRAAVGRNRRGGGRPPVGHGDAGRPGDRRRRVRTIDHGGREGIRQTERCCAQRDDVPAGGWYVAPTLVAGRRPGLVRRAGRDVRSRRRRAARTRLRSRHRARQRHAVRAHRRLVLSLAGSHRTGDRASSAPGNVYVNRATTGAVVGRQPFGGYGLSGVGSKAGGPDYLLQFLDPASITENTVRQGFAPDA